MHFPREKVSNEYKDLEKIHRCDNYQLNTQDYFHGHPLIHYKHENTVMRNLTLANKVTVAPWYLHYMYLFSEILLI